MKEEKSTGTLTSILCETDAGELDAFFDKNACNFIRDDRPFAEFMRSKFKEKNLMQQKVFLNAEISEGYGYKIISEEKRTKQRDTILRICIAADFSFSETQHALTLYGMAPLYARRQRDAVLIIALNTGIANVTQVDDLLQRHNCQKLVPCRGLE